MSLVYTYNFKLIKIMYSFTCLNELQRFRGVIKKHSYICIYMVLKWVFC